MRTTLRNKTISKSAALRKGTLPTPVQRYFLQTSRDKSFSENTITLLAGEGREESLTATIFRKILSKYARVLSKIVSKDISCGSVLIRVSLKSVNHFVLWMRAMTACHGDCSEVTLICLLYMHVVCAHEDCCVL